MTTTRLDATATTLQDGRVLIAGGTFASNSAEVFHPADMTFSITGQMNTWRSHGFTATLLPSGPVLIAGGDAGLAGAEVFLPGGTFTSVGTMLTGREYHSATLLPDGRVFVAGGEIWNNTTNSWDILDSTELFDLKAQAFAAAAPMHTKRLYQTATLLPDGTVLIAGGGTFDDVGNFIYLNTSEIYHPDSNAFTPAGSMTVPRAFHTATLLRNGKVLVAGGFYGAYLASAEIYDPSTHTFEITGDMSDDRGYHTADVLADGTTLISGGVTYTSNWDVHASAETYNPETHQFVLTGAMNRARHRHVSATLHDGRVLVAGGWDHNGTDFVALDSAEIYTPDKIFSNGFD